MIWICSDIYRQPAALTPNSHFRSIFFALDIITTIQSLKDCSNACCCIDCGPYGPLGMEDSSISDTQITASSYNSGFFASYFPYNGRLNSGDYWETAEENPINQWIQVDFATQVELSGIQTQGCPNPLHSQWVTMLQIQTGESEDTLEFVMDASEPAVRKRFVFTDSRVLAVK